eukprot:8474539-Pyramimonas_sp.AAC.1
MNNPIAVIGRRTPASGSHIRSCASVHEYPSACRVNVRDIREYPVVKLQGYPTSKPSRNGVDEGNMKG